MFTPIATFSATEFEALPERRDGVLAFKVSGLLKIRNVEKPVEIVFTYDDSESPQRFVFKGKAALGRMDFELGAEEWRDAQSVSFEVLDAQSVSFEVLVQFTLFAQPQDSDLE
jgi:polyisoprenoid-binding protein YceI